MSKEDETVFIKKCHEIIEDKGAGDLKKAAELLQEYIQGDRKFSDHYNALHVVRETNKHIDFCAGDNEKLYDAYRFRLFRGTDGTLYISQGKELDVDPRKR